MGRRYPREQWLDWLEEHRESGLTVTEFCIRKNIAQQSFYGWRKKLAQEDTITDASFVSVSVVASPTIEIELPCGATVRVPAERSSLDCVFRSLLEIGGNS